MAPRLCAAVPLLLLLAFAPRFALGADPSSQQLDLSATSIAYAPAPLASASDRFVLLSKISATMVEATVYAGAMGSFAVLTRIFIQPNTSIRLGDRAAAMNANGTLLAVGICPYLSTREPNGTIIVLHRVSDTTWEEEARLSVPLGSHMTLAMLDSYLFAPAEGRFVGSYVQVWRRFPASSDDVTVSWRESQRISYTASTSALSLEVDRFSPSGNATLAIAWDVIAQPRLYLYQFGEGSGWQRVYAITSLNSATQSYSINGGTLAWLGETSEIIYARQMAEGVWLTVGDVAPPCLFIGCGGTLKVSAAGTLVVGVPYEVR